MEKNDKIEPGKYVPGPGKVNEKELTPFEEFIRELDEEEKKILFQLKDTLVNRCERLEFEATAEDLIEDYAAIITYTKNGIVSIKEDGIEVKLRRPINDTKGNFLTDKVTLLYERNEDREKVFTKKIKLDPKDNTSKKNYSRACLAASLKNIGTVMLSVENTKGIHDKDYNLLFTCYNFFRN